METGKRLVKLLHGDDIVQEKPCIEEQYPPHALELINRAKQFTTAGKPWHHHMLFPNCMFNDQQGQWAIILEDTNK